MKPKNIWIINKYAVTPYHGMEFRHYYLRKELVKLENKVTVMTSSLLLEVVENGRLPGHIASCFDVPTLTIFSKKSHANVRKIKPFSENSYVVDFREEMVEDEVSAVFSQMERVLR